MIVEVCQLKLMHPIPQVVFLWPNDVNSSLKGLFFVACDPSLIFLMMYRVSKRPDPIYMFPKFEYQLCCPFLVIFLDIAQSEVMLYVCAPFCAYSPLEEVLPAHVQLLPEGYLYYVARGIERCAKMFFAVQESCFPYLF
jgi:hypothetical protein